MGFFKDFPKVLYTNTSGHYAKQVAVNILKRIKLRDNAINDSALYYTYTIKDGEIPEEIAHKMYGRADYDWVIMLVNDIIHPEFDWPLDQHEFESHLEKKYPGYTLRLAPNTIVCKFDKTNWNNTDFIQTSNIQTTFLQANNGVKADATLLRFDTSLDDSNGYFFINNLNETTEDGVLSTSNLSYQIHTGAQITELIEFYPQSYFHVGNTVTQISSNTTGTIIDWNSDIQQITVELSGNQNFELPLNSDEYSVISCENKYAIIQHETGSYSPIVKSTDAVHHYLSEIDENNIQFIVNRDTDKTTSNTSESVLSSGKGPVTNREYETELNNNRREIKILNPEYIQEFIDEFENILESI